MVALVGNDMRPQTLEDVLHSIECVPVYQRVEASHLLIMPSLNIEHAGVDGVL